MCSGVPDRVFSRLEAQRLFPDKSSRAPVKCNRADCLAQSRLNCAQRRRVTWRDRISLDGGVRVNRVFAAHDHFQGTRIYILYVYIRERMGAMREGVRIKADASNDYDDLMAGDDR